MRRGFKSWAEQQAVEQRHYLDLKEDAPLPAAQLATKRGVTILGPNQIPGMCFEHLACLLQHDSSSWSAVTVIAGKFTMVIHNTSHALARQESNIMHEMSHVICEHVPAKLVKIGGLPFFLREYDEEQEEEANWLGACLQLPRSALCMAIKRRMTVSEMSHYFQASEEMIRFRRQITGVDRQFSRLGANR